MRSRHHSFATPARRLHGCLMKVQRSVEVSSWGACRHTSPHVCLRSDLESALAERDHLVAEVQRAQTELQSEGDGGAEGEDAVVEEAAVTGAHPSSPLGRLNHADMCTRSMRLEGSERWRIWWHICLYSLVAKSCVYTAQADGHKVQLSEGYQEH